ncbi:MULTISPECIES: hypothetical protein [unclassified Exiguobacterium]|uniref:hypothetical protein n=1 Tax=unclassified Exiguobacterium TaxID=2644629 RepID=UPI000B587EBF|nr:MULTISPECIES: hypothetical protein [unclassified Exiguobacterium]ASI34206.1 hypothetical protein A0126_00960 [Exiguobacterium sp. N4-1P]
MKKLKQVVLILFGLSMYAVTDYYIETVAYSILLVLFVSSVGLSFVGEIQEASFFTTRRVFLTTLLCGLLFNHVLWLEWTAFLFVLLAVEVSVKGLRLIATEFRLRKELQR